MAPNGAGKVFFRLIQTVPTFWAERIWILKISMFDLFGFQIAGFAGSHISKIWPLAGLGPGQAGLDPSGPKDVVFELATCCFV